MRILHLEGGRLRAYAGNYSDFETQRAAHAERSAALLAKQRREAAHIESFVARFRAQASKARQVQSRLKWLARLGAIAEAHTESDFDWEFTAPRKLPRPLVTLEKAAAGYGTHQVLRGVSLSVNPGDRLGMLGRNGAGKSTLMRLVAGELAPQAGTRTPSPELAVGFFAQLEVEQLDGGGSPLSELARRGGAEVAAWTLQQQRDHLGRFGFGGQRVFEPTLNFSGGERSRLALAILVARRPNLLLLDEPTNHLDLSLRHTLLLALQEFPGAVIVVSHDRALLRGACDRFVLVAHGALTPFEGDLEDYAAWLRASSAPEPETAATKGASRREQRRQEAEARARRSPLTSEQQQLERRLAALARERAGARGAARRPRHLCRAHRRRAAAAGAGSRATGGADRDPRGALAGGDGGARGARGVKLRWGRGLAIAAGAAFIAMAAWQTHKPLPPGMHVASPVCTVGAGDVTLAVDLTAADAYGRAIIRQGVFDEVLRMVRNARRVVVLDYELLGSGAARPRSGASLPSSPMRCSRSGTSIRSCACCSSPIR